MKLLHELKIRALIWRHGHLGCWIITAQGCMHSVWSHPLWPMWRLQMWPDSEAWVCAETLFVCCMASLCMDISAGGEISAGGSGMENCFVCFYEFMWMSPNVSAVGWMTIRLFLHSVFFTLTLQCWQNGNDQSVRQMMQGVTETMWKLSEEWGHSEARPLFICLYLSVFPAAISQCLSFHLLTW